MFEAYKSKHEEIIKRKLSKFIPSSQLPVWIFSGNQYQQAQMNKIFKKLKQIQIETFICSNSQNPHLFRQLSLTIWSTLKLLSLSGNCIESLQLLNRVDAKNLECLLLDNNFVTNIKSIRRCCLNNLKHLNLSLNGLTNLQGLDEANFLILTYLDLNENYCVSNVNDLIRSNFPLFSLCLKKNSLVQNVAYQRLFNQNNFKFSQSTIISL